MVGPEDDPFLLGFGNFSFSKLAVKLREGIPYKTTVVRNPLYNPTFKIGSFNAVTHGSHPQWM